MTTGSVVVEAAERSGALNTARHCVHLGRPLMAVPGPVDSIMSAGCHAALRREDWGTTLVTSAADVLEVIGTGADLVAVAEQPAVSPQRVSRVLDSLGPRARAVFDGFAAGRSLDVDELVLASGHGVSDVLAALPVLERAGLVVVDASGYRLPEPGDAARGSRGDSA